jgi:hypothetical protein
LFQWLFVALICGSFAQWSAAKDITSYESTNELIRDKDFRKALPAFFGKRKANFFWSKGLIWEQAAAGLGGPPDDIEKLSSSLYLASACRLHSCDEKAAAVIKQPGQIVAVGLVEYGCFRSAYRMPPPRPTLHLYVRDRNSDAEQAIINWAQRAVSDIETKVTVLK